MNMKNRTKSELLDMLVEHSHAFLKPEFVEEVNKAFGTHLKPYTHKADGDKNPKGLTLDGGAKSASGLAGFEIAPMLCHELDVKYEAKMGRGTQARVCVEALRAAGHT
jgi:hypothetical protein